jgi:hypothetical protein
MPPPIPNAAIERAIAKADASAEIPLPIDDDYSGVPTVIEAERDLDPLESVTVRTRKQAREPSGAVRREESGLRMIGSHGRDRAEASGEVNPNRSGSTVQQSDAQRELVTILPRRITRELPIVPSNATEVPAESVISEDADPAAAGPLEIPRLPPPVPPARPSFPRIPLPGSGVRRQQGPGPVALALVVIASLMAGLAIFLYISGKLKKRAAHVVRDAAEYVAIADAAPALEPDAMRLAYVDAGVVRADAAIAIARVDAGVRVATADAGVRVATVDAGVRVVTTDGGAEGTDKTKEARVLLEQAHDALEDGDNEKALQLADASLKLRKTARTFLERARALQRLERIDEAIKSVDSALEIVSDYAPAWLQRGRLLASARRKDEAKVALEKYLELEPNGKDAADARQTLQSLDK